MSNYQLANLVTQSLRTSSEIDAHDLRGFIPEAVVGTIRANELHKVVDILVLNGQFAYDPKISDRLTPHEIILQTAKPPLSRKAAMGGLTDEAAEYLAGQFSSNFLFHRLVELNLKCNLLTEAGLEKLLNALPPTVVRLDLDFSMNCDASAYKHIAAAIVKNPKLEIRFSCHDFAIEDRKVNVIADMEIPKLANMLLSSPPIPVTLEIPHKTLDHKLFDQIVGHYAQSSGRLVFKDADNLHPEIIANWFKSMRTNNMLSISVTTKNFNLDNQPNLANVCQGIKRMANENNINFRSGNQL